MQQEARNTERHNSWQSSSNRFKSRDTKINFVSGGTMRLDELDDLAPQDGQQDVEEPKTAGEAAAEDSRDIPKQPDTSEEKELFFIDIDGEKPTTATSGPKQIVLPRSLSVSDSSEDEVVFPGRSNNWSRFRSSHRVNPMSPGSAAVLNVTTGVETLRDELRFTVTRNSPQGMTDSEVSPLTMPIRDKQSASEKTRLEKNPGRHRRRPGSTMAEEEAEIIADYIANMDKDDDSSASVSTGFPTSEDGSDVGDITGMRSPSLTPGELKQLEDIHISDDTPFEIGHVFSKRLKRVSLQYLITGKGETPDKARWIPRELLTMPGAQEKIQAFEQDVSARRSGETDEDSRVHMKGTPWEGNRSQTVKLGGEHSKGLFVHMSRDDQDAVPDDAVDSVYSAELLAREHRLAQEGRRKKGSRKQKSPSAAAFSDALDQDPYFGFDIMDFHRPSLRKKPKGARHIAAFELSDTDLELQLENAWENDRTKKKARKQQREQLRSRGLLGKKTGKADSRSKYAFGMSMDDLKSEVQDFLLSPSERYVHEIW
jgi:hypothetical protein